MRTAVDGKASITLPAGGYRLMSRAPVQFQGRPYRWTVDVLVRTGAATDVALTNDNADAPEKSLQESVATASGDFVASLFSRFKSSVFKIQAGLRHGSGFLADTLDGVIITNAHVVDGVEDDGISVVLDSLVRVAAQVVGRDNDADIAILRINPAHLVDRTRIPLQAAADRPAASPGERLVAMGFPLNQDLTITSGIASSIRTGAIISDVNINQGNSGGPLLNALGEAIAVNTFGDVGRSGGPGISGSVLISRATDVLVKAAAELDSREAPPADSLPVMPSLRIDIAALKSAADTADVRAYRKFSGIAVGGFDITVQTPLQTFVAAKAFENDIAKDRKKREAIAGLADAERYSEVRDYRDWGEYVGGLTAPVVSMSIIPKVGETGGSLFTRVMLGPNLKATYKFKGDVRAAYLYRNGERVEPIKGGHAPTKAYVDNQWVSLKDVADQGYYVYNVDVLRPDEAGVAPTIVLAVRDLKNPKKLKCRELPRAVVAQAWNDFATFFRAQRLSAPFVVASPKNPKGYRAAWETPFLKEDCDWSV